MLKWFPQCRTEVNNLPYIDSFTKKKLKGIRNIQCQKNSLLFCFICFVCLLTVIKHKGNSAIYCTIHWFSVVFLQYLLILWVRFILSGFFIFVLSTRKVIIHQKLKEEEIILVRVCRKWKGPVQSLLEI